MEMRYREGFKRLPEEGSKEQKEEEECCNRCLRHANEGVCVVLLFVLKGTFSTCSSTEI